MSGPTSAPVRLRHATLAAAVILSLAFAFRSVTGAFFVPSSSMEPTLVPGDHLLVTPYVFDNPRRGDVVVFDGGGNTTLVKRIIGLPGDSVELVDGRVLINGVELPEQSYARASKTAGDTVHIVPRDHLFLLGDNRDHSSDSREFGFVPRDAILGRARLIYWSAMPSAKKGGVRWRRVFRVVD